MNKICLGKYFLRHFCSKIVAANKRVFIVIAGSVGQRFLY